MVNTKNLLVKAKKNWFTILIVLILLVFMFKSDTLDFGTGFDSDRLDREYKAYPSGGGDFEESSYEYDAPLALEASFKSSSPVSRTETRASTPDAPEPRKVTKTARMTNEVKHGEYESAAVKIKDIVSSSNSIMLNEDVERFETERENVFYHTGDYEIKIEVDKYDSVIEKLKLVGEVESFNERTRDITEQYVDTEVELATEKARLVRYNEMFAKADEVEFQIDLIDRIFDQERTINYLEESIKNLDKRVDYSTVNLRLNEERPDFGEVKFFGLTNLFESFLSSLLALVALIFWIAPWAIALWIILAVRKWWNKRR